MKGVEQVQVGLVEPADHIDTKDDKLGTEYD